MPKKHGFGSYRNKVRFRNEIAAGAAPQITETVIAKRHGQCPLCREPVKPGESIAKIGFWAHTSCAENHCRKPAERPPGGNGKMSGSGGRA